MRIIQGIDPVYQRYLDLNKESEAVRKLNLATANKLYKNDLAKYYAKRFPDMPGNEHLLPNNKEVSHIFVTRDGAQGDISVNLRVFFEKFLDVSSIESILNDLTKQEQSVIYYFKKRFHDELNKTFSFKDPISYSSFLLFCRRFVREYAAITPSSSSTSSKPPTLTIPKSPPIQTPPGSPPITPPSSPKNTFQYDIPSIEKTHAGGQNPSADTIMINKFLANSSYQAFDSFYDKIVDGKEEEYYTWETWKRIFESPDAFMNSPRFSSTNFKRVYNKLKGGLPESLSYNLPRSKIKRDEIEGRTKGKGMSFHDPRIVRGRGSSETQIEKTHQYHSQNGFKIDLTQLKKNRLLIKKNNGQHRHDSYISNKLKDIILQFIKNGRIEEAEYQKFNLHEKLAIFYINYYLKIQDDLEDFREDLQEQFNILRGSIVAGNTNSAILQQIKTILLLMNHVKIINKNNMVAMMTDLIEQF
jgi:hypothetical protein